MPSFTLFKEALKSKGSTLGQVRKSSSDLIMERTWNNDIQSKQCYIYDYYHDDIKYKYVNKGYTYENTRKTPIEAKFIITQYGSLSKDQVEYHVLFKPSVSKNFDTFYDIQNSLTEEDAGYKEKYFDYEFEYLAEYPIGYYLDIPDDNGIYRKWMICSKEIGNQFVKYSVLPCNYHFHWIENSDGKRIKREMWGVVRLQNSYNSGLWTDHVFTRPENQNLMWLPTNEISSKIYYNDEYGNQRIIVSAPSDKPITWKISKVENAQPLGVCKFTIYQDKFDPRTDLIDTEYDKTGNPHKAMYADYYEHSIEPEEENAEEKTNDYSNITIGGSTFIVKVGGGYKTLTVKYYNEDNVEIDTYSPSWLCYIDDELIADDRILKIQSENTFKVKVNTSETYEYGENLLGKVLTVYCNKGTDVESSVKLEILGL